MKRIHLTGRVGVSGETKNVLWIHTGAHCTLPKGLLSVKSPQRFLFFKMFLSKGRVRERREAQKKILHCAVAGTQTGTYREGSRFYPLYHSTCLTHQVSSGWAGHRGFSHSAFPRVKAEMICENARAYAGLCKGLGCCSKTCFPSCLLFLSLSLFSLSLPFSTSTPFRPTEHFVTSRLTRGPPCQLLKGAMLANSVAPQPQPGPVLLLALTGEAECVYACERERQNISV